jgi:hypothetical protein
MRLRMIEEGAIVTTVTALMRSLSAMGLIAVIEVGP